MYRFPQDYRVFFDPSRLVVTDSGESPGAGQALSDLVFPGEEVQFEAAQEDMNRDNRFCAWRATIVWRKRESA